MKIARNQVRDNENFVVNFFKTYGTDVTLAEANTELWINTGRRMNLNRLIVIRNAVKTYFDANK